MITVAMNLRSSPYTLLSKTEIYRSGEEASIQFTAENITFATTKMVVFLEQLACPVKQSEWDDVAKIVRHWLRHRADPNDTFHHTFTYTSTHFMMDFTIRNTQSICPLPPQVPVPSTNMKSWLRSSLAGLKMKFVGG